MSLVWTLLHCVIMFMFLYESRYSKRKTNIITAVFIIPLVVLNMASIILLGLERATQLIIFTCVLPGLIFFFIMAKNRDFRFLFTFCVVDTIIYEVLIITNMLDALSGVPDFVVMLVLRLVIFPVLEYFMVKYIREPYHAFQQKIRRGWGVFSLMTAIFYVLMIVSTSSPTIMMERPEDYPMIILILILLPLVYITIFRMLWSQIKQYEAEEENRALAIQMEMVQERMEGSAELENRVKMEKHDLKHHMLTLSGYLENGELQKAKDYIQEIADTLDETTLKAYCRNNAVNVVLSYYEKKAKALGLAAATGMYISWLVRQTPSVTEGAATLR